MKYPFLIHNYQGGTLSFNLSVSLEIQGKFCTELMATTIIVHLQRLAKTGRDWQCAVRGKGNYCPASVKERDGTFVFGTNSHNHPGAPGINVAKRIHAQVTKHN